MIIDAHAHIGPVNKTYFGKDDLIQAMDKAGIDISVVIACDQVGVPTEKVLHECKDEARLKVVGDISFDKISDAYLADRFAQLQKKEIIGIKFYPGYQNFSPSNGKLFPIFEYCQKNNVPVIFHMGYLEVGFAGDVEQAHPKHIDAVAQKFPDLKIIIAHIGNPWLSDTATIVTKYPHVYTDLSAFFTEYQKIAQKEKEDFLTKMEDFKKIAKDFKKCLFGTDWPLYDQQDYLQTVQMLIMTEEEKELVFWKNAKNIFGI